MDPKLRLVVSLPLAELWTDAGPLPAQRIGPLGEAEIKELLRTEAVEFAVAGGSPRLEWVPAGERFDFWKTELRPHLLDPRADSFRLEDFPGEYCYDASEWRLADGGCVILLEMQH
jgi:hypothetical protein